MRYLKFANLFAPKAGAQHELLLNKPVSEVGLSNIKSDLGVTNIIYVGILCFESEVFNFLFSNFSFKID